MDSIVMARKSANTGSKPTKAGRPAISDDRKAIVIAIKGSAEWKGWVDELADQVRTDASKLIDMALVEFAKTHGFTKEAPRR